MPAQCLLQYLAPSVHMHVTVREIVMESAIATLPFHFVWNRTNKYEILNFYFPLSNIHMPSHHYTPLVRAI